MNERDQFITKIHSCREWVNRLELIKLAYDLPIIGDENEGQLLRGSDGIVYGHGWIKEENDLFLNEAIARLKKLVRLGELVKDSMDVSLFSLIDRVDSLTFSV